MRLSQSVQCPSSQHFLVEAATLPVAVLADLVAVEHLVDSVALQPEWLEAAPQRDQLEHLELLLLARTCRAQTA
jgi:hypothetical protein